MGGFEYFISTRKDDGCTFSQFLSTFFVGGSTHFASGDAASAERWLGEAEQRGLSPRVNDVHCCSGRMRGSAKI